MIDEDIEEDEDEPNKKEEPTKKKPIKATEFMDDIMEFHEQLEQAIAQKRTYAAGN